MQNVQQEGDHDRVATPLRRRRSDLPPLAPDEFLQLAERTSEAILVADASWRLVFVNRAAERMLRRRWQWLVGRGFADVLPVLAASPVYEAAERCAVQRVAVAEQVVSVAVLRRWVAVRFEPRAVEYGGGVQVFLRDLSRSRRIESARDDARRGLRACREGRARLLRELLSAVTHGRLRLCGSERDLPKPLTPSTDRSCSARTRSPACDAGSRWGRRWRDSERASGRTCCWRPGRPR